MDNRTAGLLVLELKHIRQALTMLAVNTATDKSQITKHSTISSQIMDRLIKQVEKDIEPI